MLPANERIDLNTSVAIRGESGFFFGTLRRIEGGRLLVEVDAELEQGETLDTRITLTPTANTALLRTSVHRLLVTAKGEIPRYVLNVLEITASDKEVFENWLGNRRNKGTFSNFDTVVPGQRSSAPMSQQSSSEVRLALERLARKSTLSEPGGARSTPPTDPFGVRSDVRTGDSGLGGRSGVRDALRNAIARSASAPRPPGAVIGAPPAKDPTPAPPEQGIKAEDPTYASTQTRTAQWLEVRWHDPSVFARDCQLQLCNYILVLARTSDALPDREPVRIMLRHRDLQVECGAQIKAWATHGATYRLQLDALQIEQFRMWLLAYGKK